MKRCFIFLVLFSFSAFGQTLFYDSKYVKIGQNAYGTHYEKYYDKGKLTKLSKIIPDSVKRREKIYNVLKMLYKEANQDEKLIEKEYINILMTNTEEMYYLKGFYFFDITMPYNRRSVMIEIHKSYLKQ